MHGGRLVNALYARVYSGVFMCSRVFMFIRVFWHVSGGTHTLGAVSLGVFTHVYEPWLVRTHLRV